MCYLAMTTSYSEEDFTQVLEVIKKLPYTTIETSKRSLPAIAGSDLKDVTVAIFALEGGKFSIGVKFEQRMTRENLLGNETIKMLPRYIISELLAFTEEPDDEYPPSRFECDWNKEVSGMLCPKQIEIGDPIRWFYTGIDTWRPRTVEFYLGLNKY